MIKYSGCFPKNRETEVQTEEELNEQTDRKGSIRRDKQI